MYLKSLTLKGFKSFASPTTLRFEPGISAVVGPNGSGKSNVVDALTWVMGEGSAKTLRGGNMQDVIFAGAGGKSALGRAEVTLTIDNSDGALPIEYSEVSITRRVFRDGAGEYEINGSRCRLLDVQELLSDSGIGREMHVIVGQGKLAEILESRPEERRSFIEEAAGVLKHRRRKEKAQRKLVGMQGNLDRLTDLTAELRKQLKPLGRQAEVARRAQSVQAELRDAGLRLAADDVTRRRAELADAEGGRTELEQRLAAASDHVSALSSEVTEREAELAQVAPSADAAQARCFALSGLGERTAATTRIAGERARHLAREPEVPGGVDPDDLERQADEANEQEEALRGQVTEAADLLSGAAAALAAAEQRSAELEAAHLQAVQAVADRREGLARLQGEVDTQLARIESTEADIARLAKEEAAAEAVVSAADVEMEDLLASLDEHSEAEESLDAQLGKTEDLHQGVASELDELRAQETDLDKQVSSLTARIDALAQGLEITGGSEWIREHLGAGKVEGLFGEALSVEAGWETAVGVALGPAADALVVASGVDVAGALTELRQADSGRAGLVVGGPSGTRGGGAELSVAGGGTRALDVVSAPAELRGPLAALLGDVVLVDDLAEATRQVEAEPRSRAVTSGGEIVGRGWAVGGSGPGRTGVEVHAAIEQATAERTRCEKELAGVRERRAEAESTSATTSDRYAESFAAISESDASVEALYAQLARTGQRRRRAEADIRRIGQATRMATEKLDQARTKYIELSERLTRAEEPGEAPDVDTDSSGRAEAQAAVTAARAVEVEARLAVRTAEERLAGIAGRGEKLRRSAEVERQRRERVARQAAERKVAAEAAGVVAELAGGVAERISELLQRATVERDRLAQRRAEVDARLGEARRELTAAEAEMHRLGDAAHRDEIVRAQIEVRLSELEASVLEKHGMEPDVLVAEYGPEIELPPSELEIAEFEAARERGEEVTRPQPMPYVRAEQEARRSRAEKDLRMLGKVNPLALEEFAALEERYAFLSAQLDDVKKARKDLEDVIDDVDERIERIFTEAYADVEREFSRVFEVLFPGGEGRLVLTEPDDMLATGIEVEARPPGKKIKRLSLLSGGEKSLTAVAMLVAIFKARPSPFYVMDEVEAALDDTNLRRLIGLLEDLRQSSQLIVITHQKPTMDVADVLYGVSMQGDGMSKVISHRMR